MTKRKLVLAAVALAVILVGMWIYSQVQAAKAAGQIQYRTAAAEKGDVTDAVEASGVVQALTTVDVKSRAGGKIIKLAVDVGSRVKPGDLIAKIDPSDTQSAYNQAVADLTSARARLTQAQDAAQMQNAQGQTGVREAQAGLSGAQVKLAQAWQQSAAQPALTDSAVQQAKADLASAQQQLAQLKQGTQPQDRAQAQATFDQAKANAVAAEAAYTRQAQLLTKGFVAQQNVDSALATRDVARATLTEAKQRQQTISADQTASLAAARARVRQAEAALKSAQAGRVTVGLRAQDVDAARSAVRQAAAGLETAHTNLMQTQIKASDIVAARADVAKAQAAVSNRAVQLQDATIYAPRAGVILQKYVEEGTIITSAVSLSSDGTKIVQLGDVANLFVDVSVDESDVGKIHLGQKTLVSLDALPDAKLQGHVVRIDPQAINDRDVTTVHVRVQIEHPDPAIKPGMNATCQFILRDVRGVLVVPSDAVKEGRSGGTTVRVLGKNGAVQNRKVEVGVVGSEKTQIKSGLQPGEKIVLGVLRADGGGGEQSSGGGGGFGGGGRSKP
ncbi:MAG: efflux RND transporter periplasmic adaptor subunit [Armatimonadota bacterium]|nr:efflux RND transporter periplasmic adaptor subunit [Armatimonadota bacterium]